MNRLVQVVPYYPPHVGGMEMRARDRAERLAKEGWLVETLTSATETYPHTVTDDNLLVRYLRSWEVAHTPIIFALPVALMRAPSGSIVQVETAIAYCPEVVALICKLRRMPYIARVPLDTYGHSNLRDTVLSLYQSTVLKWVYKNAALVLVLTADDVALISEKYQVAPQRIRVIPNATDFAPVLAPRSSFESPFRLLFVGRFSVQKNLPLLLRSLRYFIDTYSLPVHLDLVGDGEDMPHVRKMISELALDQHVSLRGYVTGQALERLYENADAFVMTSTRESFPQVLLETMAKGLPVVAGNIHGVRTIIEDGATGLLVDLDRKSFATAWRRLITEQGLYEKLSRGSLESAKRYSWDVTVASYIAMYNELGDGARGARSSP